MPPISAKRKIDAVLTIRQNNEAESVDITEANKAAARLTGLSVDELKTKHLTDLLPPNIRETIKSMVEFEDDSPQDLAAVLRKVSHFSLLKSNGEVAPVNLKVFYVVSEDGNPCYELLMRDITLIKKLEELRARSVEQQQHVSDVDKYTGLAGMATLKENLSFLSSYISGSTHIEVTFAAVKIDDLDKLSKKHGEQTAREIIKQIGSELRQVSRAEDTVALINDKTIGLILLDCNAEDAQNVLNRYRLKISNTEVIPNPEKPGNTVRTNCSIGFKEIKAEDSIESLVAATSENLKQAQADGGDKIIGS